MSEDNEPLLPPGCGNFELPPADLSDPVIEACKKDMDLTYLRACLKLTPGQRADQLEDLRRQLRERNERFPSHKSGPLPDWIIPKFKTIFQLLALNEIEYLAIGGVAMALQGSALALLGVDHRDVDIVYRRSRKNVLRLVNMFAPLSPKYPGRDENDPFTWNEQTFVAGLNWKLLTSLGQIDLFGELIGGGGYDQLLPYRVQLEAFGTKVPCVSVERIIQLKRAAGRPKDLSVIAELQILLKERNRMQPGEATPRRG